MKPLLLYPLLLCFFSVSCYRQQLNVSAQVKERNDVISSHLKNTPLRTGKLKWNGRTALYSIAKDSSGNFRTQFGANKILYDVIQLNGKLSRIWVYVDNPDKKGLLYGFYFFEKGEMVYKEEDRPNLVDIEEAKAFAEEILILAKTR